MFKVSFVILKLCQGKIINSEEISMRFACGYIGNTSLRQSGNCRLLAAELQTFQSWILYIKVLRKIKNLYSGYTKVFL